MIGSVEARAGASLGTSAPEICKLVADALASRHSGGGTILDVGCGRGDLAPLVRYRFGTYIGADVFRYGGFPIDAELVTVDLDTGRVPKPDGFADAVVAVETIEHLENPRAFVRELTRLAKPGGWIAVTTPNQLSLLSKLTLVMRNEFNAFRAGSYPAHRTALLEIDLRRIAAECDWREVAVEHTRRGRIPGTGRSWPRWMSALAPRTFSDNVLLIGRKPGSPAA